MTKSLAFKIPFLALLLGFVLVVPFLAFAQTAPDLQTQALPKLLPGDLGDQLLVCTGIPNSNGQYCQNLCNLVYQVLWIVYLAIDWVLWVIAPLSFITGGIMYMLAGANPSMEGQAKKVLLGAAIGVALVLCSFIIVNTVVTFFHISHIGGFGGAVC